MAAAGSPAAVFVCPIEKRSTTMDIADSPEFRPPEEAMPDSILADDGTGPKELQLEPLRLRAVMPAPPTEAARILCSVCGARPFADCWPEKPRETFDLIKFGANGCPTEGAGEWRCELHRPARKE
jgi:hypothetical protein